ncbi:M3 family metallopeptidase [Aporhodopirellula aestuarii]|uniref:M3 family metallopeptidase n=1 Tax=Aporhodopirellula aestuarii TaxID=2950107 RepID=A0ABT0U3V1_9BACT|nr:M3 family metallopeptidase [Aporhodopirellula aestuarii]MCM2371349.1 M3 family metallopeptidase [Aporhodopirellula aestuarii]
MKSLFRTSFLMLSAGVLAAAAPTASSAPNEPLVTASSETVMESPLLAPWTGPYGGVPPFKSVRVDEFTAAFDFAIDAAKREIEAIADNPEPPTFENTLLALETAGKMLDRLETVFDVHASNLNVGPIPDIERSVSPKLSAYADSITQNRKLFARIESVHKDVFETQTVELEDDAKRLLDETYKDFIRMGARLSEEDKAKLSQINARLARLFTDFNQSVLEEEKRHVTWIDDRNDLAGLSDSTIDSMAAAAKEKGGKAAYAVTNTRSSMDPFLTYAENRELREIVWRNFYYRCDNGDEYDNKNIIREILHLRDQRADLLGYPSHAHWRMESTMAAQPEAAMDLMMKVWRPAVARVADEVADMQRIADAEAEAAGTPKIKIEPWDYRFYAEKVRKEKYDLDMAEVRPYLQLDKMREAMMYCASRLFDLQFERVSGLPTFHPDVTVYEVTRHGDHVGLFYLDPFAREGKRSGAWMTDYREQSGIGLAAGESNIPVSTPIVSNNSNFIPSSGDGPILISWDDATTLFHEFGHALHGLSSRVRYPSQSGTNVARDFVEFPSQILEHWLSTPDVLSKFATHYETGEPMPADLLEKIQRSSKFNSGFETTEYLACAILDMKLHAADAKEVDIKEFEREQLDAIGMPSELPMRHRLPHFSHLFSSDAYSAGYYSYLWSDALTADAAEMFEQSEGGYFDEGVANKLRDHVLSVGNTIDPAETYRAFRGRDVDTAALLRKRGFEAAE